MRRNAGKSGFALLTKTLPLVAAFVLFAAPSYGANTFSVSMPVGTAVTMGAQSETLSFIVANNAASTNNILRVFFNMPVSNYEASAATLAPLTCVATWIAQNTSACQLPACISFKVDTGSGITPGASCAFDVVVTGPSGGAIPAGLADTTDSMTAASIVASKNTGASQTADFALTTVPVSWQRKALAVSLTASPLSTGAGRAITLSMNVANRSSATQSAVTASPDPPSRTYTGGALVNLSGTAVYGSTATTTNPAPATLAANLTPAATTIPVASTTGFPVSGRVLIDAELIDYSGLSATEFTGCARGAGGTVAASHSNGALIYSQNTAQFTLGSGEASTITWLYNAVSAGTVYFTSAASNVTATSRPADSNTVAIGSFTTQLSVTPLSLISGQNAAATMLVTNNGTSALANVTPTITPSGTAAAALAGPAPPAISSLAPGQTGTFTWTYTITGGIGQTYAFSGFATSGAITTATATSQTGAISRYGVAITPPSMVTSAAGGAVTWTVSNNGGGVVKTVGIGIPAPLTSTCGVSKGWGYAGNTTPVNWTTATTGAPVNTVTFNANTPTDTFGIPIGGSMSFVITFNCVPLVSTDTPYNFPVAISDKNTTTVVNSTMTVIAEGLTLTAYDEDCAAVAPASKLADGVSRYCLKAALTSGGAPLAGRTISFAITSGIGTLDNSSVVTDSSGFATVKLQSPCQTVDVNTTVRATLSGNPGLYADLSPAAFFSAITGSNLQYVSGSFKKTDNTAPDVASGYSGGFILSLINCGAGALTIAVPNTTLADAAGNAFTLASGLTLNPASSGQLSFTGAVTSSGTNCTPTLIVDAGAGYAGAYSYYKAPAGDKVSAADTLIVDSGSSCPTAIKILEWRELR